MAIPRNINGVNPAKVIKDGATMDDHQNIMLQSNDTDTLLPNFDDELPEIEETFEDDDEIIHEAKAKISEEVKNLDEDELDKLLGIDEDFEDLDLIAKDTIESNTNGNDTNINEETSDSLIADFEEENETEDEIKDDLELFFNEDEDESSDDSEDMLIFTDDDLSSNQDKSVLLSDENSDFEASDDEDYQDEDNSEDDIMIFEDDEEEENTTGDNSSESDNEYFESLLAKMNGSPDEENNEDDDTGLFENDESDSSNEDTDDDLIVFEDDSDNKNDEEEVFVFEDEDEDEDSEEFIFETSDNDDEGDSDDFLLLDDDDDSDDSDSWSFEEISEDEGENNESDNPDNEKFDENSEELSALPALNKKSKKKDVDEDLARNTDDNEGKNNEDENKANKKEKKKEPSALLERLKLMKDQILADIRGDDTPAPKPVKSKNNTDDEDSDHFDDEDDEDSSDNGNDSKKPKKKNGNKGKSPKNPLKNILKSPIFKIFSPLKKLYMFVVKLCFSLLNMVLGILSKLPIIGKIFKPILSASKILEKIATYMPILLVILGLVLISYMSVPRSVTADELPDGAAFVVNSFSYDNGVASATIENTGEIILSDLSINLEVYSLQPTLNPKTWVIPELANECSTEMVTVDIENSKDLSVNCKSNTGYLPRTTAKIS